MAETALTADAADLADSPDSPQRRALARLLKSPSAWLGAVLVAAFLLMAAGADLIAHYSPSARHEQFAPPSWRHWLGTDVNRHDVYSRVVYGSRLSLVAGAASILLAIVVGAPMGLTAGYFGGWTDAALMRLVDVGLSFPAILIALLAAAAFQPGWTSVILAVGLINTPMFARQVRATVLTVRNREYVLASRALGASHWQTMKSSILPAVINPILVLATLGLGAAILEVAGLSFLGVAGDPTEPEWGGMLAQSQQHWSASIWPAVGPGAAISLTILGFNLLGDGLRDALDPRTGGPG